MKDLILLHKMSIFFKIKLILVFLGSFFFTNCYANSSCDLAILTMPKAGTHLLEKALHLITNQEISLGMTGLINNKLVHFNHLWPELDPLIHDSNCLKIILFRDPRDVLISQMFWMQKEPYWADLTQDQINMFFFMSDQEKIDFLIELPTGIFYYSKLCSELMDKPDVIAFCFEDLVGLEGGGCRIRQENALDKLAQCLGYTLSAEEIANITSQLFGNTWTFRKGKIGEWKYYFNNEHKRLFKEKMGKYLIKLGYEKDDQWENVCRLESY